MFYKLLKDVAERHKEMLLIDDKVTMEARKLEAIEVLNKMKGTILEREEFSKYRDFKSSKVNNLNLFITKNFFDGLNAEQILELQGLL